MNIYKSLTAKISELQQQSNLQQHFNMRQHFNLQHYFLTLFSKKSPTSKVAGTVHLITAS